MSTVNNSTITFDLTQIQVVSFQCNQFFIKNHKYIKYGLKIILKYVGFCWGVLPLNMGISRKERMGK